MRRRQELEVLAQSQLRCAADDAVLWPADDARKDAVEHGLDELMETDLFCNDLGWAHSTECWRLQPMSQLAAVQRLMLARAWKAVEEACARAEREECEDPRLMERLRDLAAILHWEAVPSWAQKRLQTRGIVAAAL